MELTLRLIDDPAELDLRQIAAPAQHWASHGGGRAIRRRGPGKWLWRNEDGSEGYVQSMPLALTMLAFHTPDLRHLLALGEEVPEDTEVTV